MRQFAAVKRAVGFNLLTVILLNETVEVNEKRNIMKSKQAVNTHHEANYKVLQWLHSFIHFNHSKHLLCGESSSQEEDNKMYNITQILSLTQKRKPKHFILCYVFCFSVTRRLFCFIYIFFLQKHDIRMKEEEKNQAHKHTISIDSSLESEIDRMDACVSVVYVIVWRKHFKQKQIGLHFSRIQTDAIAISNPFFTHAPNWIQKQLQLSGLYRPFKWQSVKPQKFNMVLLDWTTTTTAATEKSQCDDFQSMSNGNILFFWRNCGNISTFRFS